MHDSPLVRMVQAREATDELCRRMDAGEINPTEQELMAFALLVHQHGGLLKHDLLCKIASRSKAGRAALKDIAQ